LYIAITAQNISAAFCKKKCEGIMITLFWALELLCSATWPFLRELDGCTQVKWIVDWRALNFKVWMRVWNIAGNIVCNKSNIALCVHPWFNSIILLQNCCVQNQHNYQGLACRAVISKNCTQYCSIFEAIVSNLYPVCCEHDTTTENLSPGR